MKLKKEKGGGENNAKRARNMDGSRYLREGEGGWQDICAPPTRLAGHFWEREAEETWRCPCVMSFRPSALKENGNWCEASLPPPPPPASAMLPLLPNRVWGDYPLEVYVGLEIKPSMTEEW